MHTHMHTWTLTYAHLHVHTHAHELWRVVAWIPYCDGLHFLKMATKKKFLVPCPHLEPYLAIPHQEMVLSPSLDQAGLCDCVSSG